ncbi:hypothetical protein K470DRAFT_214194 [Piedraia hortae CBS 480.64]|uniref:SH3 domain-containing protein n=1 Tax=Piedraia hortae CBS 480.64 TaxID=1314780 RepID=A0A6A7C2T3_9PEZI|nr:hypothetical protein K470DRAFT_214194 [Piedraia hortae CBS 480.64]
MLRCGEDRGGATTVTQRHRSLTILACAALLAAHLPCAGAQNCIPLSHSSTCCAFNSASVSTSSKLVDLFPFLSSVTDTRSFDSGLKGFVSQGFARTRYQTLIGCSEFSADNTTAYYARYTTSVLCNALVQNSISDCKLSGQAVKPLCADSCASYAQSEEEISSSNVCGQANDNALTQIRADFTNCALPANSLSGSCIEAATNEPNDCGFSSNIGSLCHYCSESSPNATDSCCVFSNATSRCKGVALPVMASTSLAPVTLTTTATQKPTSGSSSSKSNGHKLSGGAIAGIVVGSILGFFLLLLSCLLCLRHRRKRREESSSNIFTQPQTARSHNAMVYANDYERAAGIPVRPGTRVARMAALQTPRSEPPSGRYSPLSEYETVQKGSDDEHSPYRSASKEPALFPQRSGSLSSRSMLNLDPNTSSPEGPSDNTPESNPNSERLNSFSDYYSHEPIRPGYLVSTLWTYEPKASDEFALERGDVIRIIGIWDDGWATGVRTPLRAEDWSEAWETRGRNASFRDSGTTPSQEDEGGEAVKAFPLVCVCLPQYWRRTIEGSTEDLTMGR